MTRWISKSRVSLLALAVLGMHGCGECTDSTQVLHFAPSGPGSAAAHVHGESGRRSYVSAFWYGTAVNRGAEPCRLALYEYSSAPDAAAVPVLTRNEAAPPTTADGGVLVFESLLPGARDGTVFVRKLDDEGLGDTFDYGTNLEPAADDVIETMNVWLTVATCADPQIEVDLEITMSLCPERPSGAVAADMWWPTPR